MKMYRRNFIISEKTESELAEKEGSINGEVNIGAGEMDSFHFSLLLQSILSS